MKTRLGIVLALLSVALPMFAHRLDEYLQAIILSVSQNQVKASMRLIPGVAVSAAVISAIDSSSDGVFSSAEQQAYAQRVLHDLSLSIDGHPLQLRLEEFSFPTAAGMKEGLGEIHVEFVADLPAGQSKRTIAIENHHVPNMSVSLMNSLVPEDKNIQLTAQSRNQNQSYYRVEYLSSGGQQNSLSRWRQEFISAASPFTGVPAMFKLGVRHISEGTDHLLFLLALLLPAPLLAIRSRWAAAGTTRYSVMHILRVVTAFTLGHSLTLALGAFGLISLPGRPVEVLIAFSILVSSVHALRPLFPGREPLIAALFGLIHGLAFATTLQNLGAGPWQRIASILGFNLGIETMQMIVVAAILRSLLILSHTPSYSLFRIAGALFAAFASLGWIAERLLGVHTSVDAIVDGVAQHGAWIAVVLLVISAVFWVSDRSQHHKSNGGTTITGLPAKSLNNLRIARDT